MESYIEEKGEKKKKEAVSPVALPLSLAVVQGRVTERGGGKKKKEGVNAPSLYIRRKENKKKTEKERGADQTILVANGFTGEEKKGLRLGVGKGGEESEKARRTVSPFSSFSLHGNKKEKRRRKEHRGGRGKGGGEKKRGRAWVNFNMTLFSSVPGQEERGPWEGE